MGNKKTQGLVLWTYGHQAQVFFDDSQCLIDIPGKWRLNRRGSRPLAP
nr:hypothetical protein [bacterium]